MNSKVLNFQSFIERVFGYTKTSEYINATISTVSSPWVFVKIWMTIILLKIRNNKIIIFSYTSPQQSDNVGDVPFILNNLGYKVLVFEEWDSYKFPDYSLNDKYKHLTVYKNLWRMLTFLYSDILFTPTTRKHIYYPFKAKKINCFHSLVSLNGFPADGFLSYDIFFSSGPHQTVELKSYCKDNNLHNRLIVDAGYPKIDYMRSHLNDKGYNKIFSNKRKTVFYAPTYWSNDDGLGDIYRKCSLIPNSLEIIEKLIESYNVIFRPHPLNLKHGNIDDVLNDVNYKYYDNSSFYIDRNRSSELSSLNSDFMLSDISGTAFTYALAFNKPVLFLDREEVGDGLQFEKRSSIGRVININNLGAIHGEINTLLNEKHQLIKPEEIVFNFTKSENAYVNNIVKILNNQRDSNWEYIP